MITAEEALTFDRVKAKSEESEELLSVSEEESVMLDYLDATIESGIYAKFDGRIFDIKIPVNFAPEKVVLALKQLYEREGKWLVGIFNVISPTGEHTAFQVVFAPSAPAKQVWVIGEPVEAPVMPVVAKVARPVQTKPKVCLVSDVPGWAFDQNMRDLAAYLSHKFEFGFFYTENWFKGERPNWDEYDVIYEAYHRNPAMGIPMDRAVGAMRSQYFKPEKQGPPDDDDIKLVNSYRAFQLSAKRNYDELADKCPNAMYLTNPVDTRRFKQTSKRDKIVASWNGNAKHKAPDGRMIKHFYDIAMPACLRSGVEIVAAEYGTQEGPMRRRNSVEMSEFYQQANVALCASEYESASNSVMEAMASGLALIVTDVGNHREMRDAQVADYGSTGIWLVDRDVEAFTQALRDMTPEKAAAMGEINRKSIAEEWSWELWAPEYENFLRKAL